MAAIGIAPPATSAARRVSVQVVALTLALGVTVVVSWLAVRGVGIFNGPGPFLDSTWFLVWAIQAALAATLLFTMERLRPSADRRAMVLVVLTAWVGELLVLVAIAPWLADELTWSVAPYFWIVATGAGIQPLAAIAGGWLAWRRA